MKLAGLLLPLAGWLCLALPSRADDSASSTEGTRVELVFQGGHETDPRDHGRPVVLVAAALNVPTEVFREAFSHVHPAHAGEQPQPDQVRENKRALLDHLGPYGVTDDRLNEVSNYYRYRSWAGELWKHVDAAGYAIVKDGKIVSVTITNPGAGYSSPPTVTLPGVALTQYPLAKLAFGTDLATNGSIAKIDLAPVGIEGTPTPHGPLVPDMQ